MKKPWCQPELIVLVRSKSEEAVLTSCKGATSGGAENTDGNCMTSCSSCDALVSS